MDFKRRLSDLGRPYYHYCTADTFNEICTNRTLRFSSLRSMNDAGETKYGVDLLFEELSNWERRNSTYPAADFFVNSVRGTIKGLFETNHSLGVCLSRNGDQLSQWRAYSNDGHGFSVGFDIEALNHKKTHSALEVLYDDNLQRQEVRASIDELFDLFRPQQDPRLIYSSCGMVFGDLNAHKHRAFEEEQEIRLLRAIRVDLTRRDRPVLKASDYFPENDTFKYWMKNAVPSPYIDLPFDESNLPIRYVFIGPRNPSTKQDIDVYLNTLGFHNVIVKKSFASSYR